MNNIWACLLGTVLMHIAGILVIWNGVLTHVFGWAPLTLGDAALLELGHFFFRAVIRTTEHEQTAEEAR